MKRKWTDEQLIAAVKTSSYWQEISEKIGSTISIASRDVVNIIGRTIRALDLDTNHLKVRKIPLSQDVRDKISVGRKQYLKTNEIHLILYELNNFFNVFDNKEEKISINSLAFSKRTVERPSQSELAEIVWQKSSIEVAKLYGVSGTTIKKWCRFYGISKPSRGYWAKKTAGKI